jgi:hypothetical protein
MKAIDNVLVTLLLGAAISPICAPAQTIPYQYASPPPSYTFGNATPRPDATPYRPRPLGIYRLFLGIVQSCHGNRIRFTDGREISLTPETVIEPTGLTIRPHMQIAVHGFFTPAGHITAREIVVENGDGDAH